MNADYKIHAGWGDHVEWMVDDWDKIDFNRDLLNVYGHMPIRPRVGQTLLGSFKKSNILFEFVEVEYCLDPNDMFFAKVKAIEQEFI